jgi:simple sugar transport system ATP-binding protein
MENLIDNTKVVLSNKEAPILEMKNISKSFGHVQALDKVDLNLYENEVLGLVGDNAAGKSTLMKILSGSLRPDEGSIFCYGEQASIKGPKDARNMGIEMVYQDFALCKNLWVAGNIFMGREPLKLYFGKALRVIDKKTMVKKSQSILENLNVNVGSVKKQAGELSGGQQQSVAIARAVGFNAKIVIMDEPTASLGVKQSSRLLDFIKKLKGKNISIIYISHRMVDVFDISDRIMVLKGGTKVGDYNTKDITIDEVVKLMIFGKRD